MEILRASNKSFPSLWNNLLVKDGLGFPLYSCLNSIYYQKYLDQTLFTDQSFLITNDAGPIAGLRISSSLGENGVTNINAFGLPTTYLESSKAGVRAKKEAFSIIKNEVNIICSQIDKWKWQHREGLEQGNISQFGRHLLKINAQATFKWTQIIDLNQDEQLLFSRLSKSFRANVNWGRKNINLKIIDAAEITITHLLQFQELHITASGQKTRSDESWKCQFDLIKNAEAFLIFGYLSGELVTAALFLHSKLYCFYGVSASQREYFDNPISHSLLWEAVLHAKNLGCTVFDLAGQDFPADLPAPSKKQLSISAFKRGFGGVTHAQLILSLNSIDHLND